GARRDVDDRAAGAAMGGRHPPDRLPRADECTPDVGGEDAVETRGVHVLDAHLPFENPGVVDQRRDRTQPRDGRLEQPHDVALRRDVGAHGKRPAPRCFYVRDHLLRRVLILPEVHAHRVAAPMPRLPPVTRRTPLTNSPIHQFTNSPIAHFWYGMMFCHSLASERATT